MVLQEALGTERVELARAIERRLAERTWGRLRVLQVEIADKRLIVHAYTSSYYVKQLAIQALLEAIDPSEWTVLIDIEVMVEPAALRGRGRDGTMPR